MDSYQPPAPPPAMVAPPVTLGKAKMISGSWYAHYCQCHTGIHGERSTSHSRLFAATLAWQCMGMALFNRGGDTPGGTEAELWGGSPNKNASKQRSFITCSQNTPHLSFSWKFNHFFSDPLLSSRHPVPDPLSHPRCGVGVVDHRACAGRPVVPRQWWSGPGWRAWHGTGMAPGVEPPTARLGHPVDVHFGPLKLISFIPWLLNGPIWPKGSYPNQTKKNHFTAHVEFNGKAMFPKIMKNAQEPWMYVHTYLPNV